MADLRTWDATETAERIRQRDVSAAEVVSAAIERAEATTELGALVTETFDRARDEVATRGTGPFDGVPTVIKDLSHVAGVPTGHGSRAWQEWVAPATSDTVRQMLDLGFVSIGKAAAPEFGMTPSCEPVGLPPTHNPWRRGITPGGSSGGSAALVAAGVVPVAYASDGGGSIRIPASCCGLVGLKPSHRRLALSDDMHRVPVPIVTSGIVARTVRDVARYHAAVERQDPVPGLARVGDVRGPSSRRLRIGVVVDTPLGTSLHPDVRRVVDETASRLQALGHHVDWLPTPFGPSLAEDFLLYWAVLAQGVLLTSRQVLGSDFDVDGFDPWTRGLAAHARRNALAVPGAILRLRRFREQHQQVQAAWDVVVSATVGTPPPPIGHLDPSVDFDTHLERVNEFVPYTPAQNLSGLPAVSLPMGRSSDDLPIGVMFGGGPGEERTLLELAYELEEAHPWPQLAPVDAVTTQV